MVHGSRTFCALMVIPRSRSMSILSRYCARMLRPSTIPVNSSIRSASVDLPWSMCAMMQKFRMRAGSVDTHNPCMTAPPAAGVRLPYGDLPQHVRGWVDEALGSPVVSAETQEGGFSPGVAARLVCADGTRAFVKVVSSEANAESPDMHRREAKITAGLPDAAPAPRLLASYDEGTWVALLLQGVEGRHPHLPWREDELRRVVDSIDELFADLTPCPVADARSVDDDWRDEFAGWRDAA